MGCQQPQACLRQMHQNYKIEIGKSWFNVAAASNPLVTLPVYHNQLGREGLADRVTTGKTTHLDISAQLRPISGENTSGEIAQMNLTLFRERTVTDVMALLSIIIITEREPSQSVTTAAMLF